MFIVLDTEGIEELREIAILDHNGSLIYGAFTAGNPKNSHIRLKLKPLSEILTDLTEIAENKTIICHYAEHDRQVIKNSYIRAKIPIPNLKFSCTCELAKQKHPNLTSYSLDHLRLGSKKLPEHIQITAKNEVIAFLNLSGTSFTSRLKNFNQLTVNHPDYQFHLLRDAREPEITGKVGKEEIAKLNHTKNGKFTIIDKSDRLNFELIYNTITDIENQDLEYSLSEALKALVTLQGD